MEFFFFFERERSEFPPPWSKSLSRKKKEKTTKLTPPKSSAPALSSALQDAMASFSSLANDDEGEARERREGEEEGGGEAPPVAAAAAALGALFADSQGSTGLRLGGDWIPTRGPISSLATATVQSSSEAAGGGRPRSPILVPRLGWKGCTMISWRWPPPPPPPPGPSPSPPALPLPLPPPPPQWQSLSARSVSSLSLRVSPIPTSSPVVVGTLAAPASRSHASRTPGALLGLLAGSCASRSLGAAPLAVVSSISPCETVARRSRRVSPGVVTPALACGSRREPFDFRSWEQRKATYSGVEANSAPCSSESSRSSAAASGHRLSGLSPSVNRASVAPAEAAAAAASSTSPSVMKLLRFRAGPAWLANAQ